MIPKIYTFGLRRDDAKSFSRNYKHRKDNNENQEEQKLISEEFQQCINVKKELYDELLEFFENSESDENNFQNLIEIINNQHYTENHDEFEHFLYLLNNISNNHHRGESFLNKIFKLVKNYKDQIKQNFTNFEIFNIFKNNTIVLLYLLENQIIIFDEQIYQSIINRSKSKIESKPKKFSPFDYYDIRKRNEIEFHHFFYPEIKKLIGEQNVNKLKIELLSIDPNIFNNFDENRQKGENDSYICSLIRQDSVEEFIAHINRFNIPLTSTINPSVFETNPFLINNDIQTLIEYSAFFGSIQIFQYLMMNNVNLTPSLWFYAIHSKNAELIHLLEYNEVKPPNGDFIGCFEESLKCHHNDLSEYIETNLIPCYFEMGNKITTEILYNHNYSYFTSYLDENKICDVIQYTLNRNNSEEIRIVVDLFLLLVKKIESKYFNGLPIKEIKIPHSIISIENDAFSDCSSLETVIIPSSVTFIGQNAFKRCKNLVKIYIPSSVTSIGNDVFNECISLTEIEIPTSVTSIGVNAFHKCIKLKQIKIPSSIKLISESLFSKCSSLSQIIIPSSVTSIGNDAFSECESLKEIEIPSSVTSIGTNLFGKCLELKHVSLPTSITEIKENTFCECASIKQIIIPSSVTKICSRSFNFCSSLERITIPTSVNIICNNAFNGCTSLKEIELPTTITTIDNNAFDRCSSLTQITIPPSITTINDFTFQRCSKLTRIIIPTSITSILNNNQLINLKNSLFFFIQNYLYKSIIL